LKNLFLGSGFDLLTRAGSWACSPGKTQAQEIPRKVEICLGLDTGYRKNPDLNPDPGRSLVLISFETHGA